TARTVTIGQVAAHGLDARLILDERGILNLTRLIPPQSPGATAAAEAPAAPWKAVVKALQLDGSTVSIQDRGRTPPASLVVCALSGTLGDVSLDEGARMSVVLAGTIEGGGALSAQGTVQPSGPAVDVTLEAASVPLLPLRGYVEAGTNVRLVRGSA